jgi:hypothetical protein
MINLHTAKSLGVTGNPSRLGRKRDRAGIRHDVKVGGRKARNAEPVDPVIRITH